MLVRGVDLKGKGKELELNGLISRVFQHEIDHLNGVLIIDHAFPVERLLLTKKNQRNGAKRLETIA